MLENLPNKIFTSISEFQIAQDEKPLGKGSFGVVKRARHRMTNREYAIKIITIDNKVSQTELLLLSRQISIHYSLDHPHIIKLWGVLSKGNKIYMVMDCAQNGSLFRLLVKKKGFTEQEAFKYFYQTTDALEYMHKCDVFHRDIKPQNILLDANMNIKICDFGWVADQINRKRNTFCGTYQYMSPQMVYDKKYNYKIDIWALGILLYEMTHCRAPFPAKTVEQLKNRFNEGIYDIKQKMSQEYKKLMVSLLQFEPSKRIQIHLIKKSPWVIKWTNQQRQKSIRNSNEQRPTSCVDYTISDPSSLKESKSGGLSKMSKQTHKKHKTLEEEDLYCLKNSVNGSKVKYKTPRFKNQHQSESKQYMVSNVQDYATQRSGQRKKNGVKTHSRKQSTDFLLHKFGIGIKYKKKGCLKQEKRKKANSKVGLIH